MWFNAVGNTEIIDKIGSDAFNTVGFLFSRSRGTTGISIDSIKPLI